MKRTIWTDGKSVAHMCMACGERPATMKQWNNIPIVGFTSYQHVCVQCYDPSRDSSVGASDEEA